MRATGRYATVPEAQAKMGSGFSRTFRPRPENVARYQALYRSYRQLGRMLEETLRAL
ncbi:MAG: hypothetical protein ACUVRM_03540 [Bacillota bacterium]